jgi:hypothetical protein
MIGWFKKLCSRNHTISDTDCFIQQEDNGDFKSIVEKDTNTNDQTEDSQTTSLEESTNNEQQENECDSHQTNDQTNSEEDETTTKLEESTNNEQKEYKFNFYSDLSINIFSNATNIEKQNVTNFVMSGYRELCKQFPSILKFSLAEVISVAEKYTSSTVACELSDATHIVCYFENPKKQEFRIVFCLENKNDMFPFEDDSYFMFEPDKTQLPSEIYLNYTKDGQHIKESRLESFLPYAWNEFKCGFNQFRPWAWTWLKKVTDDPNAFVFCKYKKDNSYICIFPDCSGEIKYTKV